MESTLSLSSRYSVYKIIFRKVRIQGATIVFFCVLQFSVFSDARYSAYNIVHMGGILASFWDTSGVMLPPFWELGAPSGAKELPGRREDDFRRELPAKKALHFDTCSV